MCLIRFGNCTAHRRITPKPKGMNQAAGDNGQAGNRIYARNREQENE
jgi:hypothetical protein